MTNINQKAIETFGIVHQEMVTLKVLAQTSAIILDKLIDSEIKRVALADALAKVFIQLEQIETHYQIEELVQKKIIENQQKISNRIQINKIRQSCQQTSKKLA